MMDEPMADCTCVVNHGEVYLWNPWCPWHDDSGGDEIDTRQELLVGHRADAAEPAWQAQRRLYAQDMGLCKLCVSSCEVWSKADGPDGMCSAHRSGQGATIHPFPSKLAEA